METEVGMKYLFCSSFRLDWLVWANIILIANPGDGFSIFSICAGLMNSVHLQLFDLFCHWNIRVCACVFLWFFLYADNFRNCEFFQKFSLSALVKSFRTTFVAIWSLQFNPELLSWWRSQRFHTHCSLTQSVKTGAQSVFKSLMASHTCEGFLLTNQYPSGCLYIHAAWWCG